MLGRVDGVVFCDNRQVEVVNPLRGDYGQVPEYLAAGEVPAQPVVDNVLVPGDKQELGGVVLGLLVFVVKVLPGDDQGHDKGLARAGGHFEGVERVLVERGIVAHDRPLAEFPGQVYEVALFKDFVDVYQGLDCLALAIPIGKRLAKGQVVLGEPVLQEAAGGGRSALVAAYAPGGYGGAEAVGEVCFTGQTYHNF